MSGPEHHTDTAEATRLIDPALFDAATAAGDDFYRHVNGGWIDANPVPPEYGSWGAGQIVHTRNQEILRRLLEEAAAAGGPAGSSMQMAGDYFAAAMDEEAIAAAGTGPLAPYLARIESAATVGDVRAIVRDLQRTGASPLHSLGVAPDFEDADAYLVYLGQGGLGLPERVYYTRDDDQSVALRAQYVAHVATQLGNLGDADAQARDAAERIVALETRLADSSYTATQLRDVQLTLNRHEVASLDDLMPGFGLRGYVEQLGVTSATVGVDNPGFFRALDAVLEDTPPETLRDYLRWHTVRAFASALPPAFETAAFELYGKTLGGQKEMQPRWKRVLNAASTDIGELVAQLYVDAAFSAHARQRCEEMVDRLLSAMGRAIRDAGWMSEGTRTEALRKLDGFSYKIGFPDEWRDYTGLVIERGSFVQNRMRCAAFESARELARLGAPVDKREWEMPAHTVNAYYHPLLNEIVFPAGILQPPFFYADADDAVDYGAIGAIIGHEITHGFDDQGSHFDAQGRLRDWWTGEDRAEFERRAQVLVEQFDEYEVVGDLHVNGRLTLGENIADLGGLKIAHDALREALAGVDAALIDGFTPEQRFFLSWAAAWRTSYTDEYLRLIVNVDPHSPARARVNGPLSNLPAFAAAFALRDTSPMVRSDEARADIW
jgi:predicted metalloendopeptidase